MKKLIAFYLMLLLAGAGCVTKSELKSKERAAYLAGQKQAEAQQLNASSVWVVGNVHNPSIPWTEDLTLTKALIEADYAGTGDPSQIVVLRNGRPPTYVSAKQLLGGYNMPLLAGDRVEVRP
ncbi:MAG: hypothetical protein JWQ04_829 [Pedosphaera sp.]|nr:hypothetical protein [Pedosphaera sp.]